MSMPKLFLLFSDAEYNVSYKMVLCLYCKCLSSTQRCLSITPYSVQRGVVVGYISSSYCSIICFIALTTVNTHLNAHTPQWLLIREQLRSSQAKDNLHCRWRPERKHIYTLPISWRNSEITQSDHKLTLNAFKWIKSSLSNWKVWSLQLNCFPGTMGAPCLPFLRWSGIIELCLKVCVEELGLGHCSSVRT